MNWENQDLGDRWKPEKAQCAVVVKNGEGELRTPKDICRTSQTSATGTQCSRLRVPGVQVVAALDFSDYSPGTVTRVWGGDIFTEVVHSASGALLSFPNLSTPAGRS